MVTIGWTTWDVVSCSYKRVEIRDTAQYSTRACIAKRRVSVEDFSKTRTDKKHHTDSFIDPDTHTHTLTEQCLCLLLSLCLCYCVCLSVWVLLSVCPMSELYYLYLSPPPSPPWNACETGSGEVRHMIGSFNRNRRLSRDRLYWHFESNGLIFLCREAD